MTAISAQIALPTVEPDRVGARMTGRLVCSPFAGQVYRADLLMGPLNRPHEYAAIAALEDSSATPVLLSPWQRDAWLVELLAMARAHIPALSLTVVRMGGRNPRVQLPRELLAESVLLTHDPRPTIRRALASGCSEIMEIWQDIRTDGMDRGENSLVISLYGAKSTPAFLNFVDRAPPLAAVEVLSLKLLAEP